MIQCRISNSLVATNCQNGNKIMMHFKKELLLLVVLFLTNSLLYSQTAQEIAKKTFPALVLLVMEDANNQPISLGSGFFISDNIIVTNAHVIEGATNGYAKLVNGKSKIDILGYSAIDEIHDLVLLEVKSSKATKLKLGNSDLLEVGENIYVVGNPQGLEGTFSEGIISSIRDFDGHSIIQITAPISPGSSGGPLINSKGEVIGIAFASFKSGQNLNFAIPVKYLYNLLNNTKSFQKLHTKTNTKNEKSIFNMIGDKSTEAIEWSNFLWDSILSYFTVSIKNKLDRSVNSVYCIVIFYDKSNNPIDFTTIYYNKSIPSGLAKRIEGDVVQSTRSLASKVDIRVLDFKFDD